MEIKSIADALNTEYTKNIYFALTLYLVSNTGYIIIINVLITGLMETKCE